MTTTTSQTEYLTSRSRRQDAQRCPRARYLLHEALGHGWQPARQAVPLVTGQAVHAGLAALLKAQMPNEPYRGSSTQYKFNEQDIQAAVDVAIQTYEAACEGRGFQISDLESQSWTFQESRALIEALTRLAGLRVIPALLATYEVLEVEKMDKVTLEDQDDWTLTWRSIPDALLRKRDDRQLYILSWKTIGEYGPRVDDAARVDMQGVSEMWALQSRLQTYDAALRAGQDDHTIPDWYIQHKATGGTGQVRGVQMAYLVKGQRRKAGKDLHQAVQQGTGTDAQVEVYKTAFPLIYGYMDKSFPPKMAFSSDWRCTAPHAMRKSSWYPTGECPGDGRLHKRGDEWESFPVWHAQGVKEWMEMLAEGRVTPEAGDPLEQSYALPVPYYRTQEQVQRWLRQTRSAEVRIVRDLRMLRPYEQALADDPDDDALRELLEARLDETFPQTHDQCAQWFGRPCPCYEICHGPDHVARDPQGSGLYQVKTAYQEPQEPQEVEA